MSEVSGIVSVFPQLVIESGCFDCRIRNDFKQLKRCSLSYPRSILKAGSFRLDEFGLVLSDSLGFPSMITRWEFCPRILTQPRPTEEGWRRTSHVSLAALWSHGHLQTSRWQNSGVTMNGVDLSRVVLWIEPASPEYTAGWFLTVLWRCPWEGKGMMLSGRLWHGCPVIWAAFIRSPFSSPVGSYNFVLYCRDWFLDFVFCPMNRFTHVPTLHFFNYCSF